MNNIFKDLKFDIKLFLIVALIAVVISVGGILLLKALQSPIAEPTSLVPEDLTACTMDSECILVDYQDCCVPPQIAINKKYKAEYERHPEWQRASGKRLDFCGRVLCAPPGTFDSAKCIKNQCVGIGAEKNDEKVLDTSTWQTYRNEEFGFEFKYPADWRLVGEIVMPASYVERCEDVLRGQKDFNGCLWLGSVAISKNLFSYGSADIETTIQKFIEDLPQERIGERLFYVFHNIFEGVGTNAYFTKGPDQEYYRILYWQRYPIGPYQNYDYDENLQGIIHQILATFRFVE